MSVYVTYNDDGMITATIIGPDATYGDILDRDGKKWLFLKGETSFDPTARFVDTATKEIRENQIMQVVADKTKIVADGNDAATISGIPAGSFVTVLCNGQPLTTEVTNDEPIVISAAAPAEYKIIASCRKYYTNNITVVAA